MEGHQQEVCGLRWSSCGRYLASGGIRQHRTGVEPQPTCPRSYHHCTSVCCEGGVLVSLAVWCPGYGGGDSGQNRQDLEHFHWSTAYKSRYWFTGVIHSGIASTRRW